MGQRNHNQINVMFSVLSNKNNYSHQRHTYTDLIYNFADLWFEAHVQHAVSLIQHQVGAAPQVGLSCLQEVDQTTRGGDADLNT